MRALQGYYFTHKLVGLYEKRLAELEKSERPTNERNKLKRDLERKRKSLAKEEKKLESYINDIDDAQIKLIAYYRCIKFYSWQKVAVLIGGGNTADGVRKALTRYVEKHNVE